MSQESVDLQKLSYFTQGNGFTGSRTKDREKGLLLRYAVEPDLENDRLNAAAWTRDVAFALAEDKSENSFPLDQAGLDACRDWLDSLYQAL